jgi:putative sigma-54 modulation protein
MNAALLSSARALTTPRALRGRSLASTRVSSVRASGARAMAAPAKGTKVIVQGRHLEITEAIRDYCEQKINKAVSHFDMHDVREVDVTCSARSEKQQGGDLQMTQVTVYTRNGVVRSEEEADNLYASIDAVSDKIERKLRKIKEKKNSKKAGKTKANPKAQTADIVAAAAEADEARADEIEFEETVGVTYMAVKTSTAMEAAEEMESLGHVFYAFKNKANGGEVNVVYKRDAGGYAVLVPVDMDEN